MAETLITYRYEALNAEGSKVKGSIDATTPNQARMTLLDRDLRVTTLEEKQSFLSLNMGGRRVPRVEIMHFTRQLGAFIRAGIPIIDALEAMQEGQDNKTLRRTIGEMAESLRSGETFLEAVIEHPKVFPPFYIGMVQSSELTGNLDVTLVQLTDYIERDLEAKRKIRSALAYPLVVIVMAIITVVVLAAFVLPKFKVFFASLDAELPLPTRMLLATTAFISSYYLFLIAGIALVVVSFFAYRRTAPGRLATDKLLLRLPVIGEAVDFALIERFCRVLASMVKAGVSLPEAMQVATDGTNNRAYITKLEGARDEMMRGEGLSAPLGRTGLFPPAAARMFRVGEETGSLDAQLDNAAEFYGVELDYKIKRLTDLFEPAILLVVGLVVGFVAIALVSAMYGIFRTTSV